MLTKIFIWIMRVTLWLDDDFSHPEMMRGLTQETLQQALKTEVQNLDEEMGNDYKTNQQVYRSMITRIDREEHREDEEDSWDYFCC